MVNMQIQNGYFVNPKLCLGITSFRGLNMKMHNSSGYICMHNVNIFDSPSFREGIHNAMQLLLISRVIHAIPTSAKVHVQLSFL